MIIFVYINEERMNDLERISRWIEEEKEKGLVVIGYWNARTGKERGFVVDEGLELYRKSEDSCVNEQGKVMILKGMKRENIRL